MTAIAIKHKDEIIQRMSSGEPITSIALSLGYAGHSGIIERLADDPDYKMALRAGVFGKLEKREKELEVAEDNVTVTRADRLLGHARWWAEKLARDHFGRDQDMQAAPNVTFNVVLAGDALQYAAPALENISQQDDK